MDGQALVELALKELGCSQKELALRLGVSSTQVSKWKTDPKEHMSTEMEKKLSEIARIGERYPRFVAQAGSLKDAIKSGEARRVSSGPGGLRGGNSL